MSRETARSGRRIDRRTVLAATAGVMGLAGCSSSESDETTEGETEETTTAAGVPPADDTPGETTQPAEPTTTTDGDETAGSLDCPNPRACPSVPGSMTRFDPGATPLPVTFEYPGVMTGNIGFGDPPEFENGNRVLGRLNRCGDSQFNGDLELSVDVDYLRYSNIGRDNWYAENRPEFETFATAQIHGESVDFLTSDTGPVGGSPNVHNAFGLVPYPGENGTTYHLTDVAVSVVFSFDFDGTVTETCKDNLRTTLRQTIESLDPNPQTTFEQYLRS